MTNQAVTSPNLLKYYVTDTCLAPEVGTSYSAGIDIRSANDYSFDPQEKVEIKTGLHVEIPTGHLGLLVPRSSTGKKGLRLANTVGIIDSDYRGEITIIAIIDNRDGMKISKGDRIAQLLVIPYAQVNLTAVGDINELEDTKRGGAGFGSTGVK